VARRPSLVRNERLDKCHDEPVHLNNPGETPASKRDITQRPGLAPRRARASWHSGKRWPARGAWGSPARRRHTARCGQRGRQQKQLSVDFAQNEPDPSTAAHPRGGGRPRTSSSRVDRFSSVCDSRRTRQGVRTRDRHAKSNQQRSARRVAARAHWHGHHHKGAHELHWQPRRVIGFTENLVSKTIFQVYGPRGACITLDWRNVRHYMCSTESGPAKAAGTSC
jgi:hypothetical protein